MPATVSQPEVISQAVWLYFRFPLSLRMVEEMLAARGIIVSHESVRQWALKFGQDFANQIRRRLPCAGDKWHLDEVVLKIAGKKHWLWRAVDQDGIVLDVLVQSRRDKGAAKRLLRKLLKRQCRAPRVMITDKLAELRGGKAGGDAGRRAPAAQRLEQPSRKLAPADPPTRAADEAVQISRQAQRFLAAHDQINNLFHLRRDHVPASEYRAARGRAFEMWADISGVAAAA